VRFVAFGRDGKRGQKTGEIGRSWGRSGPDARLPTCAHPSSPGIFDRPLPAW